MPLMKKTKELMLTQQKREQSFNIWITMVLDRWFLEQT